MKVIFLDHDGVICLSTEWGGRHKKQKKLTKEINKATYLPVLEFLSLENNRNKEPTTGSKIKDDKIGKFINSKLKMLIMQKILIIS